MKTNRIAVIGGTGKSGNYLVQHLLEKGYPIKLLLRTPENFSLENPLIEMVKGDARDLDALELLVENCSAVISKIGQPLGEMSIFTDATNNVIQAMNSNGIKIYIAITGLNVDTPFDHKNDKVKIVIHWMYQNYPETMYDKQEEYELLSDSNLS